jgi:hypothetical protein
MGFVFAYGFLQGEIHWLLHRKACVNLSHQTSVTGWKLIWEACDGINAFCGASLGFEGGQSFKCIIPPPAINFEVGIKRHDARFVMNLRAPDQPSVGQRNLSTPVFAQKRFDRGPVLGKGDSDLVKFLFREADDRVGVSSRRRRCNPRMRMRWMR